MENIKTHIEKSHFIADILHVESNTTHEFDFYARDLEYALYTAVTMARQAKITGTIRVTKCFIPKRWHIRDGTYEDYQRTVKKERRSLYND